MSRNCLGAVSQIHQLTVFLFFSNYGAETSAMFGKKLDRYSKLTFPKIVAILVCS